MIIRKLKYLLIQIERGIVHLYLRWRLQRLYFFFKFLLHEYDARQFSPLHIKNNMRVLTQRLPLQANQEGRLDVIEGRWRRRRYLLKNLLLLGAPHSRLEKVVNLTFLSFCLEVNNPLNLGTLKDFLQRKVQLIERVLSRLTTLNGKRWDKRTVLLHINLYVRYSLLGGRVIRQIERGVKEQKETAEMHEVKEALKKGIFPRLIIQGCSGSYWMRNLNREIVGLFKPFDEEIHAPNNPIGPRLQGALGQRRTRRGIRVGEAAHREVAAFLVDDFLELGIVPKTHYATFTHSVFFLSQERVHKFKEHLKKKLGSFQEFIEGCTTFHLATEEQRKAVPVIEFQLLVILDLILGNSDRNSGNFLLTEDKIIAIDHGLSFSDVHEDLSTWYWTHMPQGTHPLYPTLQALLLNFPLQALSQKLHKRCYIEMTALERMRERMALFLQGVLLGLTPKDLAGLMKYIYLQPLYGLHATLESQAREIAQNYQLTLQENKEQIDPQLS